MGVPSLRLTIPRCAVLYLVYSGISRRSEITKRYKIDRDVVKWLIKSGLLKGERRGKFLVLSLTPFGRSVVEANLDTFRKCLEVLKACKEKGEEIACFEAKNMVIDVPIP